MGMALAWHSAEVHHRPTGPQRFGLLPLSLAGACTLRPCVSGSQSFDFCNLTVQAFVRAKRPEPAESERGAEWRAALLRTRLRF